MSLRFSARDPSLSDVCILYRLKAQENLSLSEVFRGYDMRALAKNSFW